MNFNPHVHSVVGEGVFLDTGDFVALPDAQVYRAEEFWQERVFSLLLDEHKINESIADSMRTWPHTGFSVDTSVRIAANDQAAMSRLVGYISRCPISLARMITRTADGKIVYRASHAKCWAYPKSGEQTVMQGIRRNHEIFEPLEFLAEMTQHIPNKGEHQIRYYGWYSNKSRGMREKVLRAVLVPKPTLPLTQQQLRIRLTWAALIRLVYEVDPLKCPHCGGTMKIVALIDQKRQPDVVETRRPWMAKEHAEGARRAATWMVAVNILKHCKLWKEPMQRGPPPVTVGDSQHGGLTYEPGYFDKECA